MSPSSKEINIVLNGAAGQGLQTVEELIGELAVQNGLFVYSSSEFMSRIRGGNNSTSLRIADQPVKAYKEKADLIVYFGADGQERMSKRHKELTKELSVDYFDSVMEKLGNRRYTGMVVTGFIASILHINKENLKTAVKNYWHKKGQEIAEANEKAAELGYDFFSVQKEPWDLNPFPKAGGKPLDAKYRRINGSKAVAEGAVLGGCDFVAAYPMSPATGVLIEMAERAETEDIIVEQAEDEIAALNMVLGASYAGARAMTTTSGGGFALMGEAVSMAGMGELPAVIHIAQRPGPATGLPTRTEQGDLNLVLYSGHGDFPRLILSPGNKRDAVVLSRYGFNMAEKYQIPVFILTDQHFVDSTSVETLPNEHDIHSFIVKTDKDYNRYSLHDSGFSPRGVPGYGNGLIKVDSDEHDESGHITEDFRIRELMVEKRTNKLKALTEASLEAELHGSESAGTVLICWGSTKEVLFEALDHLGLNDSLAAVYFPQVFPLPETAAHFLKGKRVLAVEQNVTGQFADLLSNTTGIPIDGKILKSNGEPFSVEELERLIKTQIQSKKEALTC